MHLNFGCGNRPIKEEGWVNVDKFDNVEADQVVDLFKMPYPWADNSVDSILASHFIEHIPHSLVPHNMDTFPWTDPAQLRLLQMDGFFAFFEEVGRILKPGGYIEIECPFGWTNGAFQDPTHTRYIVLQTFGYLHQEPEDDKPFNYNLRYDFSVSDLQIELIQSPLIQKDTVDTQMAHTLNVVRNIKLKLTVNK